MVKTVAVVVNSTREYDVERVVDVEISVSVETVVGTMIPLT